ncbi:hypothetical protein PQR70_33720 [Paraburkholderia madseniana]|uniref:hypothetical protein n=1 Tax=Paraburkholderia madseniana TaxID=2599607 RepID=UPI0038BBEF44
MSEKTLPPGHVSNLTPEQIAEGLRNIQRGSTDGGQTLPQPKTFEPFDARTATPEEVEKEARKRGFRVYRNF